MNSPRPLLTDALLRDALIRRAAGPPVTAVLLDDVLTAVAGTLQRRA